MENGERNNFDAELSHTTQNLNLPNLSETEGSTNSLETNGGLSNTSNSSLNDQSTADLGIEKKLKKKTSSFSTPAFKFEELEERVLDL